MKFKLPSFAAFRGSVNLPAKRQVARLKSSVITILPVLLFCLFIIGFGTIKAKVTAAPSGKPKPVGAMASNHTTTEAMPAFSNNVAPAARTTKAASSARLLIGGAQSAANAPSLQDDPVSTTRAAVDRALAQAKAKPSKKRTSALDTAFQAYLAAASDREAGLLDKMNQLAARMGRNASTTAAVNESPALHQNAEEKAIAAEYERFKGEWEALRTDFNGINGEVNTVLVSASIAKTSALISSSRCNALIIAPPPCGSGIDLVAGAEAANALVSIITRRGGVARVTSKVPSSLLGYDSVFDLRFCDNFPITFSDQFTFLSYLQAGGSLYLAGENLGFPTRNFSIYTFVDAAGGVGRSFGHDFLFDGATPDQVDGFCADGAICSSPNPINGSLRLDAPGGTTDAGTGTPLIVDFRGPVVASVFRPGQLKNAPAGKMVVLFDINIMQPFDSTNNDDLIIANIVDFLCTPKAPPTPNHLVFSVQPSDTFPDTFFNPTITVQLLDAANNLVNSNVNVTIAIGTNPGGGTLFGSTTVQSPGGTATFPDLLITNPGNGYTLTASSPGVIGTTSNPFNILSFPVADLTLSKTHIGNFTRGQSGAQYTITVRNVNATPTSGTVTVTDSLPAGLAATALSGSGWTCNLTTLTCTRSDVLGGNSSYPPITLTVNVANNAPASLTNMASVSVAGDMNITNNTAGDLTIINPGCPTNPVVTTNTDSGAGSLRQAITDACDGGTITFAGGLTSPITLSSELVISKSLTILGPGANLLTVSGNDSTRVFHIAAGNFTVTLAGLTIANGRVSPGNAGAGILNNSTGLVTVSKCTISGNTSPADGAGIYNFGILNILNSTISGNTGFALGGGLFNNRGTVTITNSTITGNSMFFNGSGAGMFNYVGTLRLTNCTVAGNFTNGDGNSGGIINDLGTVIVKNTIIAGNGTANFNAGQDVSGAFTSQGYNLIGKADGSTGFLTKGKKQDQLGSNAAPLNPRLGPLANNGGPTPTMALLAGSPAIDKGSAGLTTDQRGLTRPVDLPAIPNAPGGDGSDIGAFELQVAVASPPDHLAFGVQPSNTVAGSPITPAVTVQLLDAANQLTASTANVTLTLGANPGGGTLSGTTTVAAVNGTATFNNLSINNVGNGYTLTANSPGLPGITSNPFNIIPVPVADLTLSKMHIGNFVQGQSGAQYTITVRNVNATPTSGTVTVTDSLPAGLAATALSGSGWTCNLTTLTCTRSDVLGGNSSYPPITLTVNVANNAPASLTNMASVSGGGDMNITNNTASDLTTINPAAQSQGYFVYVVNSGDTTVSVIDTATNAVVGNPIDVGVFPAGIALTPDGSRAYLTHFGAGSNSVSVIDTATRMVIDSVTVGANPFGVAITPDGKFAYVTNRGNGQNSVSVINTATNTVVGNPIAVGTSPRGVAITPDGKFAYVVNESDFTVSVINTTTNTVVKVVSVENTPREVAITPDGRFAYVTNDFANTVSVIDTATNTVTKSISGVNLPIGVAITPDGKFAYVANFGGTPSPNHVSVIDTATNTVSATDILLSGFNPFGVAITPDGKFAYVTNNQSNSVSVIDLATNMEIKTITVGSTPGGIAISPTSH